MNEKFKRINVKDFATSAKSRKKQLIGVQDKIMEEESTDETEKKNSTL